MTRRFSASAKAWLAAYGHAAQAGDGEGARRTLDRAIAALPPRKHIKVALLLLLRCPFPRALHLSRVVCTPHCSLCRQCTSLPSRQCMAQH